MHEYWAKPKVVREQAVMFAPSLDDAVSEDHEVRLLDEVLRVLDWSEWESHYLGGRGQPPIHPRVLAGLWLYGMMRRIRTSRPLEYACGHNIDFIWLAEGLTPDHSTLSAFFSKFRSELKSLFKQVCRIAMSIGLIRLGEVAFDATKVKASNSRFRTLNTVTLEERLQSVEKQIEQILSEVQAAEGLAAEVKAGATATKLPPELAQLKTRQEKLSNALKLAQELDKSRRRDGLDIKKNPAQVPMTDPDSRVMPNKEGGYAPNYTPTCLTDGQNGFVLDAQVLNTVNEHREALPAVDRVTEVFGESPEAFLADSGMATGLIFDGLEKREITAVIPVKSNQADDTNPVRREDLTQPVPESQWQKLVRSATGQLDKSNFIYVPDQDEYVCPNGRSLHNVGSENSNGVKQHRYRSLTCEGCPLVELCLGHPKNASPEQRTNANGRLRSIRRTEHEEVRERAAVRMKTEAAQQQYKRRSAIAETPFGFIKGVMGLRQFRHRGLDKVDHEWRWICLTLNIKKLLRGLASWRKQCQEAMNDEHEDETALMATA